MKNYSFSLSFALVIILSLNVYIGAQTPTVQAIARDKTSFAQLDIALLLTDADKKIKAIEIMNRLTGLTHKAVPDDDLAKHIFVLVKLQRGVNTLNIVGYDQEGTLYSLGKKVVNKEGADVADTPVVTSVIDRPVVESQKLTISELPDRSASGSKQEIKITEFPANAKSILVINKSDTGGEGQLFNIISTKTNSPDRPQTIEVKLKKETNKLEISALDANGDSIEGTRVETTIKCNNCGNGSGNINTRAIVGLEQVGASSAPSKTSPFLDFYVNVPLGKRQKKDNRGVAVDGEYEASKFAAWTNFRISSATAQNFAKLSNVTTSIFSPISGANSQANDIVQSFIIKGGLEFEIVPESKIHPFFLPGKTSLALIAGGGVESPLNSSQKTAQIFKIPRVDNELLPEFAKAFGVDVGSDGLGQGDFEGKTNIAFVTPQRDRFFRSWFGGFRLKTQFYKNETTRENLTPATFDFTFGQDEAVTRILRGFIFNFEGFTPFPVKSLDYIYIFGGAKLRLTSDVNENVPSFFLQPGEQINLTNSNDTIIFSTDNPLTLSNRDSFRFGFGVDLVRLFNRDKEIP